MLGSMEDSNKKHIQGLFAARMEAEESHSLTMKGYGESFKEIAEKLGVEPGAVNKAYADYKFAQKNPDVKANRDALYELVFNS